MVGWVRLDWIDQSRDMKVTTIYLDMVAISLFALLQCHQNDLDSKLGWKSIEIAAFSASKDLVSDLKRHRR